MRKCTQPFFMVLLAIKHSKDVLENHFEPLLHDTIMRFLNYNFNNV